MKNIRIVYVPFDVQRLTDEVVLDFQIGSNSFAMWNMEINQIECNHKAALVTPDERQGMSFIPQYSDKSVITNDFSSRWLSSIFLPDSWCGGIIQFWI